MTLPSSAFQDNIGDSFIDVFGAFTDFFWPLAKTSLKDHALDGCRGPDKFKFH